MSDNDGDDRKNGRGGAFTFKETYMVLELVRDEWEAVPRPLAVAVAASTVESHERGKDWQEAYD